MSDIKQKARDIIGKEVMPTDKTPITIHDFSTYNKGYNYAKKEILQKIDQIIDLAIADYQTNFEQKHIVSAVEVDRKRIVEMIEKGKEEQIPTSCPDNMPGCLVYHFKTVKRDLTAKEIINLITNNN